MLKIKYKLLLFLLILTMAVYSAVPILAQDFTSGNKGAENLLKDQNKAFFESAGLEEDVSIAEVVSDIIKILLSFLGVIFIVLIIYAGFRWMVSRGNEEEIGKAKKTMTAAIIGLAIVLSAYLITYFVIDQLLEATKGGVGLD